MSFRLARLFVDPWSAAAGVLATWIGSHALYYSLVSPAYSHSASMLACALFLTHWIGTRESISLRRLGLWGTMAGVAALMRWQDAVLLVIPVIEACRWRTHWSQRMRGMVAAAAGFLAAFSPQMLVWAVLYGQPFAIPQGPSFMQWRSPHLFDVLWSDSHGLFSWAPILLLSTIGLAAALRRHRAIAVPIVVIVLLTWYVNASVADWWGGEAFGARRFLSLFPLFSLGLAVWISPGQAARTHWWRLALLVALIGSNWLLLLQYQLHLKRLTTIAPYPHGWPDMWVTRFIIPFRLLRSWLL
jgi:hypothetical protein